MRVALASAALVILALCLAGCGQDGGRGLGERVIPFGQPVPKGGGRYQIGEPYQIGGVWYRPREEPGYDRVGTASWYGELFHGRYTANGEIYDMDRLSAAHPTLPLPVYAQVTNLSNGRSIIVRVNDRGPFANDRVIDLSRRSAQLLGFSRQGTTSVRVKYLKRAPLSGDDSYERGYLASRSWMRVAAKKATVGGKPIATASLPATAKKPADKSRQATSLPVSMPEPKPRFLKSAATLGTRQELQASLEPTGSIGPPAPPRPPTGRLVIQAGSFKNRDNADRARSALAAIAPVEMAEMAVGADVYFRITVGPFPSRAEAESALARVVQTGYEDAKILARN
ncbi:MAG: septal ring lytic transglycosylase RlpA family protein [Methyloceanibacter sp.]